MSNSTDTVWQYFHEHPNQDAAWAATALFLVATLIVLGITIKTRAWFMMCVVVTGFLETLGYVFRGYFLHSPKSIYYIQMQCFLIISPVLLAIVEYIVVGKLLKMSEAGKDSKLAKWVGPLFTISDVLCLVLQGAGGGAVSQTNPSSQDLGRNLLLAGIFLQLFFFSTFLCIAVQVHLKPKYGFRDWPAIQPVFYCLYSTIALMYVRNIFRVIEFCQGWHGYLATHEVYFYVFDFVPIYACFMLFSWFHYGFYLQLSRPSSASGNQLVGKQAPQGISSESVPHAWAQV